MPPMSAQHVPLNVPNAQQPPTVRLVLPLTTTTMSSAISLVPARPPTSTILIAKSAIWLSA